MKNRGITLIEVIIYISLILFTFFISSKSYRAILEKQKLKKEIIEITSLFRKNQKISEIYGKHISMYFDLENKEIYFGKTSLKLSDEFTYLSKNKYKNNNFERYFTEYGNLNKGFNLIILNKSGNIIAELSFDSSNSISYPVITVKGINL
ncbi:pilus assembly FimT family protein [Streptobacillus notomytis]|uniref:pilus assembly FimT family protein n=1 Tax=Streptobacillus notomytis TaxID=1712031 RepID=UPI000937E101|nr:hypothetical protein [Streptobacillus notomytis]